MSQPDHGAIVDEIRSVRLPASPELRERVLSLATAPPPAPPRRRLPWRRLTLVLVPTCLALAIAGALAGGLVDSGRKRQAPAVYGKAVRKAPSARVLKPLSGQGAADSANLPTTPGRAELYEAELTLKVSDLSATTKRALSLTQGFRGYVRSVDYGAGRERGTATLVLRVPVGSIQAALVRFSTLGEIVDQHVSIQDVQPQLDRRFRQMQSLRDAIAKLQARLADPDLSVSERSGLERELVQARRRLLVFQREQARQQRQASFATVSLDLRSVTAAVVAPDEPGRIGRALDRSGSILLDELKVVVYVLIVGAPLLVLAAVGVGAMRLWRRRVEARLLAR
jgi:hypothetical protein